MGDFLLQQWQMILVEGYAVHFHVLSLVVGGLNHVLSTVHIPILCLSAVTNPLPVPYLVCSLYTKLWFVDVM